MFINALVQVISFRTIARLGLLRSEYLGFSVGWVSLLICEFRSFYAFSAPGKDYTAIFVTNLITYASLGYCYFHFINLGETARRIRILRELYDAKAGLSMEEIIERYSAGEIIEKRITRLTNHGQIILKDGGYFIGNSSMLFMAKVILFMKILLLGRRNEFDNHRS